MPGEREIDHLLDIHTNAQCLIGRVEHISRTVDREGRRATLITLDGLLYGSLCREVLALDQGTQMFPGFLVGRIIRVVCRSPRLSRDRARYDFLHLAHVDGLTRQQRSRLWPWREDAYCVLTNPRLRLSPFEEGLCQTLMTWGRPPSPEQARHFRRIAQRQGSATNRLTRDALLRVARHRPHPRMKEPTPLGILLQGALNELRDIWLQSQ